MKRTLTLCTLAAVAALASCGGETLAVLGFIGSAGGDFVVDADPNTAGLQRKAGCAQGDCRINVSFDPPLGDERLYASTLSVRATGDVGGAANACNDVPGRIAGRRLELGSCFQGEFKSLNEVLSDDGQTRLFFDNVSPSIDEGVWFNIHDSNQRFKFTSGQTGCERVGSASTPLTVDIQLSDTEATPPSFAGINNLTIQRTTGAEVFSGQFVGISGMRLTRAGQTLELERRRGTETCP